MKPMDPESIRARREDAEWWERAWDDIYDRHKHRHRAHRLRFTFSYRGITVQGDHMTFTMLPTQSVPAKVSPVKADGTPSPATLSSPSFVSDNPTLGQVSADPANPSGVIIAGQGTAGSFTVTAKATATEPDGTTTEIITGSVTIILAVPPPAPAAALVFTFGTPTP